MWLEYAKDGNLPATGPVRRNLQARQQLYRDLIETGADLQDEEFDNMTCEEMTTLALSCRHMRKITDPAERHMHGNVGYFCSCKYFVKNGYCKHSMAFAIAMRELLVPPEYNIKRIGSVAKPGRPKSIRRKNAAAK